MGRTGRINGGVFAISGRSRKTLDEAVKTIGGWAVQADVAKLADPDTLYAEVSQKLGKIDVLFVNAGVVKFAPPFDCAQDDRVRVVRTAKVAHAQSRDGSCAVAEQIPPPTFT